MGFNSAFKGLKVKFLRATQCEVVDEYELALDMFCTAADLYKHADDLSILYMGGGISGAVEKVMTFQG